MAMTGCPAGCRAAAVWWRAARPQRARNPVGAILRVVSRWIGRAEQRRCLAALSDWSLRDIGVTRCDALRETGKPFWRG
jgi:uncharacterized protein YjiS (DUF1127 family)